MKAVSGKRMCQLLEDRDWSLLRVNGSHHIYGKPGHIEKISIPVHGQRELKPGLQRHVMRIAGIEDRDLF
jgi:predicted RNA binding protein YcfA (HicA-like mRNA interferase family)